MTNPFETNPFDDDTWDFGENQASYPQPPKGGLKHPGEWFLPLNLVITAPTEPSPEVKALANVMAKENGWNFPENPAESG